MTKRAWRDRRNGPEHPYRRDLCQISWTETAVMAVSAVALLDTETATRSPMSACQVGWALLRCVVDVRDSDGGAVRSRSESGSRPDIRGWSVTGSGQVHIRPPRNLYNSKNIQIHGISPAQTVNAPSFVEAWRDTVRPALIDADVNYLMAWNAAFDAPVLWCSLVGSIKSGASGTDTSGCVQSTARTLLRSANGQMWRIGCAMRASARALPSQGKIGLKAFTERLGVTHFSEHDAAADSEAAAQVLCIAANRTGRSPTQLCDRVHGGWWQFGRTGPQPVPPYTANLKPAGVLHGVQRDGRLQLAAAQRSDT